ncbi:hypothetical protein HDU91_005764, partial [Kappamyces sp. JEL0680]
AAADILQKMQTIRYSRLSWKEHPLNPKTLDSRTADWIFLVDLLNFSFWTERHPTGQAFQIDGHKGYWSLCAAINRALDAGIPVTSARWMAECTPAAFDRVFAPDNGCQEIPMRATRINVLRRAGAILLARFPDGISSLIRSANRSALALLEGLFAAFGDLFYDGSVYHGEAVVFHKRAQIFVADLWACFDGQGLGAFDDINQITMFADYRVPQTLLYFGILEYSPELTTVLKRHEEHHDSATSDPQLNTQFMLNHGDEMEVEIRGGSILAVELLVERVRALLPQLEQAYLAANDLNAIIIDFYLWDLAQEKKREMQHLPIHRVRSIYY